MRFEHICAVRHNLSVSTVPNDSSKKEVRTMSFYSYKNCNQESCPGTIKGECRGLREKVCVQVKKVYDSCMKQEQLERYA